jgi:hypothetical protein
MAQSAAWIAIFRGHRVMANAMHMRTQSIMSAKDISAITEFLKRAR